MKVWGARIQPPNLNRALAAWLHRAGLMGRAERAFFEQAIRPGQFVVDVGANQGIFAMLFSRLVGPEGRVVALEPEPRLFAALSRSCSLNDARNLTCLQKAAGETRGDGVLHCSPFNSGDNRLSDAATATSRTVPIVPLDEILPTETVHLIKIDVQGYELRALRGMQKLLDRSPGIRVFFEYFPEGLAQQGHHGSELIEFFLQQGFSLADVSRAGARPLTGADLERVKKMGGRGFLNLLARREGVVDGVR